MTEIDVPLALLTAAVDAQRRENPGFPLISLAYEVAKLGAAGLAAAIADEAEHAPPHVPVAAWFAQIARVYALIGRAADVDRLVPLVIDNDPADVHANGGLAVVYERLGRIEPADAALARLPPKDRKPTAAAMGVIAADAGRIARAEKLAKTAGTRDRSDGVKVRLHVARAHHAAGDVAAAMAWLERAIEIAGEPKHVQPTVDIAIAAAELGATARALELARAVDRATPTRDGAGELLDLARAYQLVGEPARVQQILASYTAARGSTASGRARCAEAYARLGLFYPVRKLLDAAESALKPADDNGHQGLATAYAANRDILHAVMHAVQIVEPWVRILTLVKVARDARAHPPEITPAFVEVLAAM